MSERPTDPDALIRSFCSIWAARDLDEILSYFTEDATYHNMPLEPAVGTDAIRGVLDTLMTMTSDLEFEIVRQLVDGDVVMNERIDTMTIDGRTIELPVAGAFEVRDGRIVAWRDYFDMSKLMG